MCGRARDTVKPRERWLEVEIFRFNDDDVFDEQGEGFCSQEHAAEWMLRPLPPVSGSRTLPQRGWRDRLAGAAVASAFGLCAAACLLGVVTAVRWLLA